jgi:hypothetical protein
LGSGVRSRRRSVSVWIKLILDDENLTALADYFDTCGKTEEKQALVIKPAKTHPYSRLRSAAAPTRTSIAEQLLIDRAGDSLVDDEDYTRFDKSVKELIVRA